MPSYSFSDESGISGVYSVSLFERSQAVLEKVFALAQSASLDETETCDGGDVECTDMR